MQTIISMLLLERTLLREHLGSVEGLLLAQADQIVADAEAKAASRAVPRRVGA